MRGMNIHPTAIIEDGAELGADVTIGPMCNIGPSVRLHDSVRLQRCVVVEGDTEIGARTVVHPFAVLGGPPQHLKHGGEDTRLIVGADVIVREHVTMNTGTVEGGGVTRVGDRGFFMIGSHVAHDCNIGSDVICSINVAVGGHVEVGEGAFLGGQSAIHQFCRIGDYAFVGGCAAVITDIIPYASAFGNHAQLAGLNIVGLKRRGLERSTIHDLRAAYKVLFGNHDTFKERVDRVREEFSHCDEVRRIVNFIDVDASRPLMTPRR
jgi:UDP-N-acetylglucosamine acyltransferase